MRVFLKAHDPVTSLTLSFSHTEIPHVIPGSVHLEENSRKRHIWSVANMMVEVCAMQPTQILLGEQVPSICTDLLGDIQIGGK